MASHGFRKTGKYMLSVLSNPSNPLLEFLNETKSYILIEIFKPFQNSSLQTTPPQAATAVITPRCAKVANIIANDLVFAAEPIPDNVVPGVFFLFARSGCIRCRRRRYQLVL